MAKKKANSQQDELKELLASAQPRRPGSKCQTCAHHRGLVPVIHEYAQMRAGCHPSGETTDLDVEAFARVLIAKRGYSLEPQALRRHLHKCEREIWSQVNE